MFWKRERNKATGMDEVAAAVEAPTKEMKKQNSIIMNEIQVLYYQMGQIINQHEVVNDQHGELAELADELKMIVEKIQEISSQSNESTNSLKQTGNRLGETSKES